VTFAAQQAAASPREEEIANQNFTNTYENKKKLLKMGLGEISTD